MFRAEQLQHQAYTHLNLIFDGAIPMVNLALPIRISFFTFQAISYVIDVYRGDVAVQKNPLYVALYISFFPQLIAGPIVRYVDIEKEIDERHVNTTPLLLHAHFAETILKHLLFDFFE